MTLPSVMSGVWLTGHGGFDKLEYRDDIPVPVATAGEVLIQVAAAGVNNTDINTRTAWYSKTVTSGTNSGAEQGFDDAEDKDGSWSGAPLQFPRIQGADCTGTIVGVGEGVAEARLGERVLVRSVTAMASDDQGLQCFTIGSERDGGFAQYMTAASKDALAINCNWSDVELASVPCAYSTAEGMMQRAKVDAESILITGASGGVGSAAVQLAKRRGAQVIAISSAAKMDQVKQLGADRVIDREADLLTEIGENSLDVVADLVAGDGWPNLLKLLKKGGRYVTSGAIAGPMVELDVRTLYLKDLTLLGSTYQPDEIFINLINYIENDEIKPFVGNTYPLKEIVQAQQDFLQKKYPGKLVLIP